MGNLEYGETYYRRRLDELCRAQTKRERAWAAGAAMSNVLAVVVFALLSGGSRG